MSITYTALLGLAQPTPGTESGTWGTTINDSLTALLETAIAGSKTADVTSSNWTLTDIDGADDTARAAVLIPTGTNGATTRSILAPNQSKIYVIINQASGSVVIKGVTGPTTGVTIPTGKTTLVAWSGSDFVEIAPGTSVTSVTGTSPIVSSGGLTPAISISQATTSVSGYLTNTDWNTFNGKYSTGGALGTPASGTLTNCTGYTYANLSGTVPTWNQNTTGTAANLTAATTLPSGTTLVAPLLGTPASGTLTNCTADGTNAVGYKNIPKSGSDKVTSYSLVTTDVGKYISVGSGGSITVPDATFSAGDAVSIFNNTSGSVTLTMTITTAYIGGTDADKATITLATRGLATILFLSGTVCVVSGNVS
jgi:hypothetical protein